MQNNNTNKDEIDLAQVAKSLWSNAIPIAFVSLVGAIIAFVVTLLLISPKYSATATMYVNNTSFSFGNASFSISSGELNAANALVGVYTDILNSRTTLEKVIEESGVSYSYQSLAKMIYVESTGGSGIFSVRVESPSPMEAELIANTIAKILPDRISEIVDGASVRIVDYAIVPAHRSSPSFVKNTVVGLIAGFLICAGIISVRSILLSQKDAVIQSADDLKKYFPDIPVLSVIPDMSKASKKGYYYSDYYSENKPKEKTIGLHKKHSRKETK